MGTLKVYLKRVLFLKEIGGLAMLTVTVLVFYLISAPFLSIENIRNILLRSDMEAPCIV